MPENRDDIDLEGWDLHRATAANRLDIARALIEHGADVDGRNKFGHTLLSSAINMGGLTSSKAALLIERGANTEGIDLSWMN
jgi:ankyrin repeat protein